MYRMNTDDLDRPSVWMSESQSAAAVAAPIRKL